MELLPPPPSLQHPIDLSKRLPYSEQQVCYIRCLYAVAILVWVGLIWLFRLYDVDWVGWVILALPIVVFIIGFVNAWVISPEVEEEIFRANYLSIGLLIVLPLLTCINRDYKGDRARFTSILVLAIVITMLSMYDVWTKREWLSLMKHAKSVLQTMSLTLLIYALYMFYISHPQEVLT